MAGSPYPLCDLLGRPRPITLAGTPYMVAPLTLEDLADLGAFGLRGEAGDDPIEACRRLADDAPQAGRAAAARAAQDFAAAPPPDVGSPGYRAAMASPDGAGVVWLVHVALRRHNPGFGLAEAASLVARMAEGDRDGIARLSARAFGTHKARRLAALAGADGDDDGPIDWPGLVDRLAVERGWTYEAIGRMTLPAVWSALRGGKAPGVEYTPRKGESTSMLRRRVRRFLGLE